MSTEISLSDYISIRNVAFEWTQSYDNKDWDRLRRILAPSIRLDYRGVIGILYENLNPDEYVAILSGPKMLGDKRMKSQHLLGVGKLECLTNGTVHVWHQTRVAHQRYDNEDLTTVVCKGHGYGTVQHWYRKIDGVWKLEAVEPKLEWSEDDLFGTLHSPEAETEMA